MNAPTRDTLEPLPDALSHRLLRVDWAVVEAALDESGHALLPAILTPAECRAVAALYDQPALFRSRVVMARHGFGRGEYQYFSYPLPDPVSSLRAQLYPRLVPLANCWSERMGLAERYPPSHTDYISRCHRAGQTRPTPLLLRYGPQDYNCLHQDLYGDQVFPLQVVVLLSEPGQDFSGGELVMTEQRPRMQSRPMVLPLHQGDAAVIAVHHRPVQGTRSSYRVNLRHGVSLVTQGSRHTLGIIFHDAI